MTSENRKNRVTRGPTAGQRIHAWLSDGNRGTPVEISNALGLKAWATISALSVLKEHGMAAVVGTAPTGRKGTVPNVWASTFVPAPEKAAKPEPEIEHDPEDYEPVSCIPAASVIAQAMANRHPLDIAWLGATATGANP